MRRPPPAGSTGWNESLAASTIIVERSSASGPSGALVLLSGDLRRLDVVTAPRRKDTDGIRLTDGLPF